jgi:hypothetical protein
MVVGEPNVPYRLQASTNLAMPNWIELLMFTNAQPATTLTDPTAPSFSQRFYQVVSP